MPPNQYIQIYADKEFAHGDGSETMNMELTICPPGTKGK